MSYFAAGQWNADCDQCGRMFKSGSLRRQWNGLYTCSQCWEPRQPQDFVRAVKDNSPPAYIRGGNFSPTITTLVAGFLGLEDGDLLLLEDGSSIRLETDITASDVLITVLDGSMFPTVYSYYCSISDGVQTEGVKVTNKTGNVFTVVRGYNSIPVDWDSSATFSLM